MRPRSTPAALGRLLLLALIAAFWALPSGAREVEGRICNPRRPECLAR